MRRPSDQLRRFGACQRAMDGGEGRVESAEAVEAAGKGVTRSLPSRVRVVPSPVRGRAHRLTSPPPHRPRGSRSHRALLDGLSSPGFQQMISDILLDGDGGYRPDTQFDGSQVHLDLNEPVSGPSHAFMALGGTPPSAAHVPGGSWEVPFMEPARLPTPPASPAPTEQPDQPAARGRARRAPRRPPCGTGGHR
ncbi:hypothetical protein PIB30_055404 [Stylosanthes scabra]|uniref:Uncharacterized protein n=1 Tax=Stylosanthes scabra TaxID=79078 RepID=A0ABU6WHG0_9FABA|nr:hypothetical protein [Stylosanthes scabra]